MKPLTYAFLLDVTRGYRVHLGAMVLITIMWSVDDSMLRPYAIKLFIDQLAARTSDTYALYGYAALYLVLRLCVTIFMRLWDWLSLRMVPGIKALSLEKLTMYAMRHPQSFMQRNVSGMLASSICTSAEGAPYLILPFVGRLFGSCCRVIFAISALWAVTPFVATGMSLWALFFLGGGMLWALSSHHLADLASTRYASVTGAIVDTLLNSIYVHLFGHYAHEAHRIQDYGAQWALAERKREGSLLSMHIVQGVSFLLLETWSLWMIITGYNARTLSIGDTALIISINTILIEALWDIPQEITHIIRALGKLSQGLHTIVQPYELSQSPQALPLRVTHGKIEYHQVSFSYPDSALLFRHLSITIPPRQKVGLVGYSGSGKTTLINLLVRLFDITKGTIYIDDQDISQVQLETLRNAITYISQDALLFHRSIAENIAYGNLTASMEDIIKAAQYAAIHEDIMCLSNQYNTIAGERGTTLSAGQKQRIIIARAYLKKSPILIIDEATSALDYCTESQVQYSLRTLMEQKTAIVIAHRFSTLHHLDRILVLDNGTIVQDGSYASLLNKDGLLRDLWNAQIGDIVPHTTL